MDEPDKIGGTQNDGPGIIPGVPKKPLLSFAVVVGRCHDDDLFNVCRFRFSEKLLQVNFLSLGVVMRIDDGATIRTGG